MLNYALIDDYIVYKRYSKWPPLRPSRIWPQEYKNIKTIKMASIKTIKIKTIKNSFKLVKMSRLYYFLILSGIISECLKIPDKVLIYDNIGVMMEPVSISIHYRNLKYITIAIKPYDIPIKEGWKRLMNECSGMDEKLRNSLLRNMIPLMLDHKNFLDSLPKHIISPEGHYCKDDTIDCMMNDNQTFREVNYKKRAIPAVALTIVGGIFSIGTFLYDRYNQQKMKEHLYQLEQNQEKIINFLKEKDEIDRAVVQISEDIYLKNSEILKSFYKLIAENMCKSKSFYLTNALILQYISELKNLERSISHALNGRVTRELIPPNSLMIDILSNEPELSNSIYYHDIGLFYELVTSYFVGYDVRSDVLLFLLSIPIVNENTVSPIYKIYNYGWNHLGITHKFQLPDEFFFSATSTGDRVYAHNLLPETCIKRNQYYLCNDRSLHYNEVNKIMHLIPPIYSESSSSESEEEKVHETLKKMAIENLLEHNCYIELRLMVVQNAKIFFKR